MRLLFTLLFLSCMLLFRAQTTSLNNALKMRLEKQSLTGDQLTVLIKGDVIKLKSLQREGNYTFNYSSGDIASITCNSNGIAFMLQQKLIIYAELIESRNRPMNDTMVVRNRIKPVKTGISPLPQAYNGTGILVGLIDTGVDFNHGDFKDAQGNSRIRFLWDQVPVSGSSVPAPYNYGIEWTDAQINAGQCTHDDLGHYGHGTHVTGIAAGNGLANGTHEGCASKADIIMVALDFNRASPTIADAVQYIFSKATQLNKPCVINASVGDYYGSHDGTNLEAKAIDNMVTNISGRVMVASAGNAGNIKYHVKTQPTNGDTLFTWLNNGASSEDYYCYADTNDIKNLKISIGANRTNFFNLGRISFKNYNYALTSVQYDTLKYNNNRLGIIKTSASINADGVYELLMHIDADTSNLVWRVESTGNGLHHAWNFDFVSAGLPTTAQYPAMPHYAMPDTFYTLVSGFQCSKEIITVANYINLNRYYDVNNTLQTLNVSTGAISANSSLGPTRDGRQKPDIAATGDNIFSCMALGMQANLIANLPTAVAPGSLHVGGGGTSASSPVVAGLAALYLQRYPLATNADVRNAITLCAYHDNFTGNHLPNYSWGYGKLDGKAALICGEDHTTGMQELISGNAAIHYFPNPFTTSTSVTFDQIVQGHVYVYAQDGKLIFDDTFLSATYEIRGHAFKNYTGLLFVKIVMPDNTFSFKLIKEN